MPTRSEKPSQTPIEERLRTTFQNKVEPIARHIHTLGEHHWNHFGEFLDGLATNGVQIFWGTKRYDQDMERAGRNAMQRPFGIEMNTLSPNTQLILYPSTVYKPDDDIKQMAEKEGYNIRESGTQVMIYFLDGFEGEMDNIPNLAANVLFISHMTSAALNNRYPLGEGETSPEFLKELKESLEIVGNYVRALSAEQRTQLASHISKIPELSEYELSTESARYLLYDVEPLKMSGLYDHDQLDLRGEPEWSIENKKLYLHLDERNLPQRIKEKNTKDVPAKPWVEYGRNRWNRSCQLFGRYEAPIPDGLLRLDFRLDSTHMPALYGFFDTLEVTRISDSAIRKHIIFGQDMGEKANLIFFQFFGAKLAPEQLQDSVIPVIIAGDFDFNNSNTRVLLEKLASDKGTKPDVSRVVMDILRLSAEGKLQRIQRTEDIN